MPTASAVRKRRRFIALLLIIGTCYGLLTIAWRLVMLRLHNKTTFAPHEIRHIKLWGGLNVAAALPTLAWAIHRLLPSASLPHQCTNAPLAIRRAALAAF